MQVNADEYIRLQGETIKQMEARILEQEQTIADLRSLVDELRLLKAGLEETLEEFKRQLFGTKSEKTKTAPAGTEEGTGNPAPKTTVKEHTRTKKRKTTRDERYADIPVRDIIIPVLDEERRCPYCNAEMTLLGHKEVRTELRITPAKVERVRYMQEELICPECHKDGDGTIVQAKTPVPLMLHSPASPSIVAYVMSGKSFVSIPYYRQESCMAQLGLELPRETMANWYIRCALEYFRPVYDRLHGLLLQRDVIHADETTCQVLREKGKAAESTSYMWLYLSGSGGLPPIVLYEYQAGRSGDFPKAFLYGFSGIVQCDGYSGYNKVEDVILAVCSAHCRRKFYEALPAERRKQVKLLDVNSETEVKDIQLPGPEQMKNMVPAEIGLVFFNKLFFIEKGLKGMEPELRKEKRLEKEAPVWEKFWAWIETVNPLGGSKLEKAVNYAINHRETLQSYMLDGRCELSNNAAERCAKSYAIGRKNFLFHASAAGAEAAALVYSMIETAKANKLNVFQYLYVLLLYMPDYKNDPAAVEMLLPWSSFIKDHCTGLIDVETITPENKPHLPL
ncbi:MAG: IS66 family transposase [Lachnospiraceae bacterium]|nr:IS66 family transposase [Lachnospiraceae bacterium]